MQNDILWHYRFPHPGWEYDCSVNELHHKKPNNVDDPYTPNGINNPALPNNDDDICNDHTLTKTWKPDYPEKMRKVNIKSRSSQKINNS
jgi:transketolase